MSKTANDTADGPPASKRQRRLETAFPPPPPLPPAPPAAVVVDLVDLPTFRVVVSFLNAPERCRLAETCRRARGHVDAHCARVLEAITGTDNCNVDATFDARIRDQSRIQTARAKPVVLPPRYLLAAALKREPLFTIGMDTTSYDRTVFDVVVSPSQGRVAVDIGECIYVYDLNKTRKKLTTLFHRNLGNSAIIFPDDNHILSRSEEEILLWTQGDKNGDWNSSVFFQNHRATGRIVDFFFCPDQHNILVATVIHQSQTDGSPYRTGIVFDFLDVECTSRSEPTAFTMDTYNDGFSDILEVQIAGVFDQKRFVFRVRGSSQLTEGLSTVLYVYDIEKKRMVQILSGCRACRVLKQAPTCPSTFYAVERHGDNLARVVVLDFDVRSGLMATERFSFPVEGLRVLATSKSHIFVGKGSSQDIMGAYNLETGTQELWVPYRLFDVGVVATAAAPNLIGNRNELLVVAGIVNGIKAFCISEPQL